MHGLEHISIFIGSIPIHHPAGTTAILSIVWNSLSRFKDHLIENEANTLDRLSTIMAEAVLEGCMPFGSHLHMDKSLLEGNTILNCVYLFIYFSLVE